MLLVGFLVIAVMNILTGIFLEQAQKASHQDVSNVAFETHLKQEVELKQLRRLFNELDEDGDGCLTWEEFKHAITKDSVESCLEVLGIHFADALGFFRTIVGRSD